VSFFGEPKVPLKLSYKLFTTYPGEWPAVKAMHVT